MQLETTSLLIENVQAGFLLAALYAMLQARDKANGFRGAGALAGLLAGAALSTKFGSAAMAIPIAIMAAIAAPRQALMVVVLFLAFALPPYVNAWIRVGNPLFPFLGDVFPSKYTNASWVVKDVRWTQKANWRSLYDLTFNTSKFLEGQNGAFGFQSLLLVPLIFGVPVGKWPSVVRIAFFLALGGALAVLLSVPYLRYLYPAMAFSTLALAVPLALPEQRFRRAAIACTVAVWLLNLAFLPSAGWYQKDFILNPFKADAAHIYQRNVAPMKELAERLNVESPGAAVAMLDCTPTQIAYFTGPVYMNAWHSGDGRIPLQSARDEDAILSFVRSKHIHWFLGCSSASGEVAPNSPAQRFFKRYTEDAMVDGDARLARLLPNLEYAIELLKNGDFSSGFDNWQAQPGVKLVEAEHAVRVTERLCMTQHVAVTPGTPYKLTVRARCTEPETYVRVQFNWADSADHALPASGSRFLCGSEWTDYSDIFQAPKDAASGYYYVTGHTQKPVLIQAASMKQ